MSAASTPFCDHRENRVYTDCHGPYALGRSRHGAPVRRIQIIPSTKGRCGFALRPPVFVGDGSNRKSFVHCSSLNRTSRSTRRVQSQLARD